MGPLNFFVGISHITSIYNLNQGSWLMVTSHTRANYLVLHSNEFLLQSTFNLELIITATA